ncbi:hypothetical protein FF38_09952, partial [Lucilia cuprina]
QTNMFNFHKPRTYRSTEGCCICKAKSSSSRFTDSRKYERDTMQCFDLKYPRQGEICNACVLLVKRFKRLPVGSKRNWSHIVDAKAGIGPGYNKIQTKYKSERINSRAAAAAAALQQQVVASSSTSSNNAAVNGSSPNGINYIPEKFSKIFKKTKKLKDSSMKRKNNHNGWSHSNTQSLPTTPDSLDSDYEDSRHQLNLSGGAAGSTGTGTIVQFQTQTRASAYKAQAAAEARKRIIKLGTKRRKCLPPRRFRRTLAQEESVEFFDEEEWQERKSCCGMLYECAALGGALIINADSYKPCEQHQQSLRLLNPAAVATTSASNNDNKQSPLPLIQKSIIQTVPAVVQLKPPTPTPASTSTPSVSVSYTSSSTNHNNNFKTATTTTTTPTPVLKKHHLFFKRQSECFPQGDHVTHTATTTTANSNNDSNHSTAAHVANIIKTESEFNVPQQQNNTNNSTTIQRHIENAIHSSSPNTIITTNPLISSSASLSISVTTSSSSSSSTTMPQMPKHSLAKVTTISPPLTSTTTTTLHHQHQHHLTAANNNNISNNLVKPNTFLHKIKADSTAAGKVVKHSLEKFNTAVRLKTSDIHEMKPIIRTVDKSYILAKPPTQANIITLNANTSQATYQSLAAYNAAGQPPLTTASLSAASPTSSTSSTSSTKFSDNSSDSGFDENMLDRKSASPLQEDCEKKILSRPGVQTMFLASGVQIQGQPQNLVLTGNEVAAKILQSRKYSSITANPISTNSRSHHPTTTAVKIAQISTTSSSSSVTSGPPNSTMSSAAQAKMRAIYNNNNMIQHENGITTIVPASSLAATTQTAAMQNIAPSTVTITPAPPVGTQFNTQNVISRKLTAANIINLQSNTTSNSHNNQQQQQHHHQQQQQHHQQQQQHHLSSSNNNHHHLNNSSTNQKIILLKTSPNNTTTFTATAANYNTLSGGGGGGGHHGNNGGGGR